MTYAFARIGAVVAMRVDDYYPNGKRWWVRLHEKGGKEHEMPCHNNLEEYLHAYLQQEALQGDRKGWLFRSAKGRSGELSERPMSQSDVYRMIGRRATAAGVATQIGCHSFRATGITEYLRNGGRLEVAQQMAHRVRLAGRGGFELLIGGAGRELRHQPGLRREVDRLGHRPGPSVLPVRAAGPPPVRPAPTRCHSQ